MIETSVSKGQDVPRDVPGQTGTGRPAVPLSRDKDSFFVPVSLCPGTRPGGSVPGRPGTKNRQKMAKKGQKMCFFSVFSVQ